MDSAFCVDALEEAISKFGCPEIFNTDHGSQFTAEVFTNTLRVNNIAIGITVRAAGWTAFLLKDYGEASSTRTFI